MSIATASFGGSIPSAETLWQITCRLWCRQTRICRSPSSTASPLHASAAVSKDVCKNVGRGQSLRWPYVRPCSPTRSYSRTFDMGCSRLALHYLLPTLQPYPPGRIVPPYFRAFHPRAASRSQSMVSKCHRRLRAKQSSVSAGTPALSRLELRSLLHLS